MRTLSLFHEQEDSLGDTMNSKQFRKQVVFPHQIDKIQREVRQNEELQVKLQEQVNRKDENLKKHTEVVERLYEKYKILCNKSHVEPRIQLTKNAQGIIDVTLVGFKLNYSLTMQKSEGKST